MTQTLEPPVTQPMPTDTLATSTDPRAALLQGVFAAFNRHGITYCVTHGYTDLLSSTDSDVDLMVAHDQLPAVRAALDELPDARLLQWMNDGAVWAVLQGPGRPGKPALLQLHMSRSFELADQVFYMPEDVLASRRRRDDFWVPSPEIEFACICVNRAIKGKFRPEHLSQLADLFSQNPPRCERELREFFKPDDADKLLAAARTADASLLPSPLPKPIAPPSLNNAPKKMARFVGKMGRRVARWTKPQNGIHLVFLGPDGVGKSTVIDAVREAALPAFLRTDYQTFAPSLIPGPLQPKKDTPHQLPPRSKPASYVKAAWWSVCYTAGYFATIRPAAARASLVLNHRYLLDAMVDPKRYRYAGPQWPLHLIWLVAPKPDLIFLLDAPAEVIQARKQEVAPEETARQREGYRGLVTGLKNARIVNTHRSLTEVTDEVLGAVFDLMAKRTAKQRGDQ